MATFNEFNPAKMPKHKVELHVHLDGSIRLTTVWELAQKKKLDLGVKTLDELFDHCMVKCPSTLEHFLKPFCTILLPVVVGDPEAIERMAYEFCEDAAKQGVLYCETRYCPHLFSTTYAPCKGAPSAPLMPRDVVQSVSRGLSRGSADFEITVRSILCCFRGHPEWSAEILGLCVEFKEYGVVGIDIAGDEAKEFAAPKDIEVFKHAADIGIHRTVHAGEAGPADNVRIALQEMHAERIGHGYHVVDDPGLYSDVRQKRVHFEVCPYSSCLTGSVPGNCPKHPIVRFAEDDVNFSINRDDPTIIQKTLDEEYAFLRGLGMREVHFARANFNAARASFLPPKEKQELLKKLQQVYGTVSGDGATQEAAAYVLPTLLSGAGDII